jgi:hypothetical protein
MTADSLHGGDDHDHQHKLHNNGSRVDPSMLQDQNTYSDVTTANKSHVAGMDHGILSSGSAGNVIVSSSSSSAAAATNSKLLTTVANPNTTTSQRQPQSSTQPQTQQSSSHHPTAPTGHFDTHRFEKISNIVKQFKLSCEKAQSQFQGMEVSNSKFSAFIDAFTVNTYIMVIVSRKDVHTAATLANIKNARRHFERFIPRS